MPDLKLITMQLELSFWSLTIRLLSESRLLRSALPYLYRFLNRGYFQPGVRLAVICSLSGFLLGLIVGMLSII